MVEVGVYVVVGVAVLVEAGAFVVVGVVVTDVDVEDFLRKLVGFEGCPPLISP